MSYSETHSLKLDKAFQRSIQHQSFTNNLTSLLASINGPTLAKRGWSLQEAEEVQSYRVAEPGETDPGKLHIYTMNLVLSYFRSDGKEPQTTELATLLQTIAVRASQASYGGWTLAVVDAEGYVLPADGEISSSTTEVGYADVELPEDFEDYFSHLFGLENHRERIRGALEAAIDSGWENRFHCVLIGPPGCGKSDMCQQIKKLLGEDAVLEFDATATTQAGAIDTLRDRAILPRVMIVEEIEKADPKTLAYMLSLMDLRGEIRKTTAKATIMRDTKLLVIATVNNKELFKSMLAGALYSRFANKIHFKRPSRETRERILRREVNKVHGNHDWIGPTLDYCEKIQTDDPREMISLCLCGREKWLTGEFATMLAATSDPDEETIETLSY